MFQGYPMDENQVICNQDEIKSNEDMILALAGQFKQLSLFKLP